MLFFAMWFQVVVTFVQVLPRFYSSADEECGYDLAALVAVINKLLPIELRAADTCIVLLACHSLYYCS